MAAAQTAAITWPVARAASLPQRPFSLRRSCCLKRPQDAVRLVPRSAAKEQQLEAGPEEDASKLSDEYTDVMQDRMGSASLTYRHEDGMNYTRILDDLIVGSCLQTPQDADRLADAEDVRTVMCLQEDSDMVYFSLDVSPIQARITERGTMQHVRHRIRDFDPFSLRMELPGAVAALARSAGEQGGTAYVHCTAGLGRAPATALAYMWWFKGWHLEDAYEHLTGLRPCKPKVAAIRAAAADLLYGGPPTPVTLAIWRRGFAQNVQVAGLDVGWGQQVPLSLDATRRFVVTRHLPPGTFQFKFIMDGRWTYSMDHPAMLDGDNINNFVTVPYDCSDPGVQAARERVLAEGGPLTDEERQVLQQRLGALQATGGGTTGRLGAAAAEA